MSDIYIVGIDMIPFVRKSGRTAAQLGAEAALLALDDCGLSIRDIEALYCGNVMRSHLMVGQRILHEIGETAIPVVNVSNACATGATAFREGLIGVSAGLYDLVLTVGAEQMDSGLLALPGRPDGFVEEGELGSLTTPAMFSLIGNEHARHFGTTFEQFAKVAVKNHHHATFNPKAAIRRETPLEEVMASEMIAFPNTKLMCSINTDGAAAAVIASEAAARRLGLMNRAIRVRASELTSGAYTPREDALTDFNVVTQSCVRRAYEAAAVGPEDLALIELHDCFATAELLHYICLDG